MLLRSINGAGQRKVDFGLKIVMETYLVLLSSKPVLQKRKERVFYNA